MVQDSTHQRVERQRQQQALKNRVLANSASVELVATAEYYRRGRQRSNRNKPIAGITVAELTSVSRDRTG